MGQKGGGDDSGSMMMMMMIIIVDVGDHGKVETIRARTFAPSSAPDDVPCVGAGGAAPVVTHT